MKSILAGLVLAIILVIPASSRESPRVTGYIVIAHQCATSGEIVLLVFSDGTYMAERVENIPADAWPILAEVRSHAVSNVILVKGPFDTCPKRL